MANTTDLRKGGAIRYEGKLFFVLSIFFVSPGKGSAFYRTKLKEISTGKSFEKTFKSGESIDLVDVERRGASFLYQQGDRYFFMENDTYEQYDLTAETIGDDIIKFLKKEAPVMLLYAEEEVIAIDFTKTKMSFEVTEAPPAIKGDTVSNAYRSVTIETGASIQVPMFIRTGDRIVINTETGEYSERERS